MVNPEVTGFFDPRTFSMQYVVACPNTSRCAVIDPVLDYDEKSGTVKTENADRILDFIAAQGLRLDWILDTHPHADHLTAAQYLKAKTGAPTAIGAEVRQVQRLWREIYNLPDTMLRDDYWDHLFEDGERFSIGDCSARVMHSPGHTLASITYVIGDAAFIHDTLFMPDSGSARADFPGGSAVALWRSIQAILALPAQTRLFTGHDYQPGGRQPLWQSSIDEQLAQNPHLRDGVDQAKFVTICETRDAGLPMPKLILHALQVNIRGGRLPEAEANGQAYLKIPLGQFGGSPW